MRTFIPLKHRPAHAALLAALALFAAISLQAAQPFDAQPPSTKPAAAPLKKPVHRKPHPSAVNPAPAPVPVVSAPAPPPPPELPHWPLNDLPAQASVAWDSQGLRIIAANSSLQQILKDVSTATGTKVEGLASDQRIFGAYGPGQARDVLAQLLDGTGYNVLMIGDQGQGLPRQLVLSVRTVGGAQSARSASPARSSEEDVEVDEPPQEVQPQPQPPQPVQPPVRPGFAPGGPPRTPQQIMQEMQQRQQQLQQEQQQQLQNNPPN